MVAKKFDFQKQSFVLIGILVVCFGLVYASHDLLPASFSVDEDSSTLFNITVDNTDAGQEANITQVNITLPSSFSFVSGSQGAGVAVYDFASSSTVLSWTNSSEYLINGSETQYFWFNATPSAPGEYNLTITTVNATNSYSSNIPVTVNDTTSPVANLGTSPGLGYNTSNTSAIFTVNCSDNYNLSTIQIWSNWTGTWEANQTNTSAINNSAWNLTIENIPEGSFVWAVYCNDTAGNSNWSANDTLRVDITAPTLSDVSEDTAGMSSFTLSWTTNEYANSKVYYGTTEDELNNIKTVSTWVTSHSVEVTSLTSGTTYYYKASSCDVVGNCTNSSRGEIETDSSSSSSSSSGGTTTTSTTNYWTFTQSVTGNQFQNGYTRQLGAKQRLSLSVENETHYVGVISLTSTSAVINVSSDPQQATFSVGDVKKFDVTDDNYYDLQVTLTSISNSLAEVKVQSIHEEMPADAIAASGNTDSNSADASVTSTDADAENQTGLTKKGKLLIVIPIFLVVAIVAVVVIFYKDKIIEYFEHRELMR